MTRGVSLEKFDRLMRWVTESEEGDDAERI